MSLSPFNLPAASEVLIIGMGESGRAAAALLEHSGYTCRFFDDRNEQADWQDVARVPVATISAAVISPGIPWTHPLPQHLEKQGIPVFSEIETAIAAGESPWIGITGSNGKTTTTSLIASVLDKFNPPGRAVGNIGRSWSGQVLKDRQTGEHTHCAVELSSFQLERFRPRHKALIGLLLNLSPDHLNRHGTMDNYLQAKLNLLRYSEIIIYNLDDPQVREQAEQLAAFHRLTFSLHNSQADVYADGEQIILPGNLTMDIRGAKLRGPHNVQNMLAAAATGHVLGYHPTEVAEVLTGFQPLSHRLESVAVIDGVEYVNDSKATNADATRYALQAFPGRQIHLLAGGQLKSDDLLEVPELIQTHGVRVYLFGQDRERIASLLPATAYIMLIEDMKTALHAARRQAAENDVVLLSPMCASYDQFQNFEQRGDRFRELASQSEEEN